MSSSRLGIMEEVEDDENDSFDVFVVLPVSELIRIVRQVWQTAPSHFLFRGFVVFVCRGEFVDQGSAGSTSGPSDQWGNARIDNDRVNVLSRKMIIYYFNQ